MNKEIENKYDYIDTNYYEDLLKVRSNGKYGFINRLGEEVIPLIYEYCSDSHAGLIAAYIDPEKWGCINAKNEIIVPFIYGSCTPFNNGLVIVMDNKNGKYGIINNKGEMLIQAKYNNIEFCNYSISTKFIMVELNNKCGCIDIDGNILVPSIYNSIFMIGDKLFIVKLDNKCGIISDKNEIIVPLIYDQLKAWKYSSEFIKAKLNNKYGYINIKNEVFIPIKYDSIPNTNKDCSMVIAKVRGKHLFVDNTGKEYEIKREDRYFDVGSRRYSVLFVYHLDNNSIIFNTGCFLGNLEEFKEAVYKTHYNNHNMEYYNEYMNIIKEYE